MYVKGYNINWDILYQNELQQRIPLPTYPFAKDHYWITSSATEKLIGEKTDISQLAIKTPEAVSKTEIIYYQPVWKPSPAVTTVQTLDGTTVVISNQDSLVSALRKTFPKVNILQVKLGESYVADKQSYVINKNQSADFIHLIEDLNRRQLLPKYIIYENDLTQCDLH